VAAAEPKLVPPPRGGLVRVGRQPTPILWRDPRTRLEDEDASPLLTGNRFDAPNGEFRTVYFGTTAYGAWLEKLSPERPISDLAARIEATFAGEGEEGFDTEEDEGFESDLSPDLVLDADFFDGLVLAEVQLHPDVWFIDVEHEDTLAALSQLVGRPFLERFGLDRFDRGVPLHRDRRITRSLALELYLIARGAAVGLKWTSVHASGVECWALWENAVPFMHSETHRPFDLTSPDLRNAAATLRITVPDPAPPPTLEGLPESW
jgi:hypothetical protein